jgi:hypothetical protein
MALTCSLLGHDFGESEVDREREERGSEVVTSVREVATCRRCGAERVVSENTEVTTAVGADSRHDGVPPDDASDGATAADEPDPTPAEDDATESEPRFDPSPAVENYDPDGDDAVVLSGDPDQRDYGDWPSEPGQRYQPWDPETLARDDDGEEGPTVAEILGEERSEDGASGATDDPTDADRPTASEAGIDAEDEDASIRPADGVEGVDGIDGSDDPEGDDGGAGASPAPDPGPGRADDGAEVLTADGDRAESASSPDSTQGGSYYCPSCGYHIAARDSSYRPGDSCPSCQAGYLAVTERNP